jgi:predicted nuclease of predicted toxin-antitoxin system
VKFLVDAQLPPALAVWLRARVEEYFGQGLIADEIR